LLPLYIYGAKISLCINVASKRNGAQLLLENGILEVLGHCEFIGARPKSSTNKGKNQKTSNISEKKIALMHIITFCFRHRCDTHDSVPPTFITDSSTYCYNVI
jgi:hypothetical protein